MSDRKPSVVPWIAGIVLVLLVGVYVGTYYRLVEVLTSDSNSPGFWVENHSPYYDSPSSWGYRSAQRWQRFAQTFFEPIHWVDCQIRPHVWSDLPIADPTVDEPTPER